MSDAAFQPRHITPSEEQLAIQLRRTRLLLVEANAGAAKTTTLALRIAQALHRGAPPESVLALTTTEPAVDALKARLAFIGVEKSTLARLRVLSYETFSREVLAIAEGGTTPGLETPEQVQPYVVRAVERALTLPDEPHPDDLDTDARPADLVEGLLQSFDTIKGRMLLQQLDAEQRLTPAIAADLGLDYLTLRTWLCYEFIRRGGHPDHPEFRYAGDGPYDLARQLLSGEVQPGDTALPHGLALICVDEMHDLNRAAFTVLKAVLASSPRAAFVGVGDRDQVIHAQTGAEAAFMAEHFKAEIGQPEVLPLTTTRRFSTQLAQHVGALARKPYAADPQAQTHIALEPCDTPRLAAELIARLAQAHHAQTAQTALRVLLRHASQSVLIEHELLRHGIAYGTAGFAPYLARPEILLVRGLHAHARQDYAGFSTPEQRARLLDAWLLFTGARVDSLELRHLDARDAQRVAVAEAAASADSTHSFVEGHALRSAQPAARRALEATLALLRSGDADAFEASFLTLLDPHRLAARVFVREADAERVAANITQLHRVALAEGGDVDAAFRLFNQLDAVRQRSRGSERVVLSSIEAAKGLEFDHVVLPHLTAGEFGAGTVENRNLLYVALTRSRQRLTLTFDPARPSRFLKDARFLI
ncbi:3'-5' exonuclease [Roseateles sp. BYS87W]|uniref:DNA 3'-5' helicase n=1 Tax=Pelomonas baiyunensis TaxID=3299026 RepID=A0ABW7GW40_9BURK